MYNEVLLVIILVEAAEEVDSLISPKQVFDSCHSRFWQLRCEEFPVAMFDLKEPGQVIGFVLHKANETSIQLLVAFNFILELALLMPVQLFFIHW